MRAFNLLRVVPMIVAAFSLVVGTPTPSDAQTRPDVARTAQETAVAWIDAHREQIIRASDELWNHAELSFEEFQSYKQLTDMMRDAGFTLQEHVAGMPTSFIASFTNGKGGPVIGIVSEFDAMPALSQEGATPYYSPVVPGGPGHGCGHNLIGASSAAAAIAVKEALLKANIPGTITLFSASAEEEYIPKVYMSDAGLFNGVAAALAWHPGDNFEARYGTNNALTSLKFVFTGKNRTEALKALVQFQDKAGLDEGVVRAGDIPTVGGTTAEIRVFVSEPTREAADRKVDEIRRIADEIASATATKAEMHLIIGTYQRLTNDGLVKLLDRTMRKFAPPNYTAEELELAKKIRATYAKSSDGDLLPDRVKEPSTAVGGANDNGDTSWITPFISVRGGVYVAGQPGHSWQNTALARSTIGYKGAIAMTKTLAVAALELLTRKEVLAEVREEFEKKTKGFVYRAYIPKERNSLQLLGKRANWRP